MWQGPFRQTALASLAYHKSADPRFSNLNPVFDPLLIGRAELWWITPELSRLVDVAAKSLPPTTLTEDLIPKGQAVLAYFAEPLHGTDVANGEISMDVRVIGWMKAKLSAYPGEDHMSMTLYADVPHPELPLHAAGRTDWRYGSDTDVPSFPSAPMNQDAQRIASMAEDRRWLAALTLLSRQAVTESRIEGPTNKARLRRLRKAGNFRTDVRVVDLHQAARLASGEGGTGREVEHDHRWMVGADTGGFWKQVPYGPESAYRKSKWIMPYIAGPDDKPLRLKETVKVVRQGQGASTRRPS